MMSQIPSVLSDATLGRIARMLLINRGNNGHFEATMPGRGEGQGVARILRQMGCDVKEVEGGLRLSVVCPSSSFR